MNKRHDRSTALSDVSFEAVFIFQDGYCIDSNTAASTLFGYSYDELIGIFGTDVIADESKETVLHNMLSEYEEAYEAVCKRKDGSTFYGEIRGKMYEYQGEKCRASVVRDVSLYKETLQRLEASEARYDLAIKGTTDGIWDWDRETDQVYFSPRWKEIIGYADYEIDSDIEEWKKRIHPDDIDRVRQVNDLFFYDSKAEHFSVEYRLRHKNGQYVWILGRGTCQRDEDGVPYRMAGSHTDITLAKENEKALMRSERKWRNILENTPQIGVTLGVGGTIVFVNEYFCSSTGWERDEVLGLNWFDTFIPEEDREKIRAFYLSLFTKTSMEEYYNRENEILCKDGGKRHVAWSNVVSRDATGRFVDVTSLGVDLTERERMKESLQYAKEKAEKANEAKSVFLATMSHEIRTPLNGIMGMLQLAQLAKIDDEGREYIDMALSSSRDLLHILSDVLDLSRIEAGLFEISESEFESSLMIAPVINSLKGMASKKGLDLQYEILPSVPEMLKGDIGRIRQILINLIHNAIKYSSRGKINVSLECVGEPLSRVCKLRFRVRDAGHGIPPDRLEEIWEPYAQIRNESYYDIPEGIGLGLSIVRKLVGSMGGKVEIDSIVGVGTTVVVTLPLKVVQTKLLDCAYETVEHPGMHSRPIRVLLVEDDKLNQLALTNMLQTIGVEVDIANNGKEAVTKVLSRQYDIIFMDVQMPVMNGVEATRVVFEQVKPAKRPPIVAMTAFAMYGDKERFLASGMDDYLSKPVEFDDLLGILTKYLGPHVGSGD